MTAWIIGGLLTALIIAVALRTFKGAAESACGSCSACGLAGSCPTAQNPGTAPEKTDRN